VPIAGGECAKLALLPKIVGESRLDRLSAVDYQALRAGAVVLEADGFGEKVLQLADGRILKLFRRKRLLSSALYYPYARRFADNAHKLAAIGVPVPAVEQVWRIPSLARDAVLYAPLPGISLRKLQQENLSAERRQSLRLALSRLVAKLFDHGMIFRSLHTGNVIVMPDGELGLIDFSDMRFYPWSLGRTLRQRGVRKMLATEGEWLDTAIVFQCAH
jgi:tRNA A-37 threonylcarbamoyl transferase component Bud32